MQIMDEGAVCLSSALPDVITSLITYHLLRFAEVGEKFDTLEEHRKSCKRSNKGDTNIIVTVFFFRRNDGIRRPGNSAERKSESV